MEQRNDSALSTQDLLDAEPSGRQSTEEPELQLFAEQDVDAFRTTWQGIQAGFVDDPQTAVREADELVADVIQSLASTFAEHKRELEGQWQQGEAATEELRVALQSYRSFFNQLLGV